MLEIIKADKEEKELGWNFSYKMMEKMQVTLLNSDESINIALEDVDAVLTLLHKNNLLSVSDT